MAKKPTKVYRIGLVSAAIYDNPVEGSPKVLHNVQLNRRYRDGDTWKTSHAFGLADLPQAIRVLQLSQQYVEEREADASPEE